MEVLVSVLIPVYNTEKYVRECVESVRKQTLHEIEILCLDDGSTDRSAEILDELATEDERIHVMHKKNSGYGSTMNLGIRAAQGKYVGIVESDDYIEPGMMKELYRIAETEQCDFVKSDFAFFWKKEPERVFEEAHLVPQNELYGRRLSREEIKSLFRGYIANCTGVYNKKFLMENQIFYNETPGASYQDQGFFFQVMMKAQRGYLSDQSYYRYRQDNLSSSVNSRGKVYCICDEHRFIYQKVSADAGLSGQYLPIFYMFCFQGSIFNVRRIAPEYRHEFLERVRSEYQKLNFRGELDLSAFYEEEKEELSLIMDNPETFLEKIFQMPLRLQKAAEEYSTVIIYGAGARGHEVCGWLKETGKANENLIYAISDKASEKRYKDGIRVMSIYELGAYVQNSAVIVAVTKRYQNELLDNLNRIGFQNIITLD